MKTASELPAKPPRPLRAYLVTDGDPESQTIQFARSNVAARRAGAIEIDADFGSVTCRREPWADEFAGQSFIPAQAYIEQGWWVGCMHCGDMVCSVSAGEDIDGNPVPHEPVYCGDSLYCMPSCQEDAATEKAARAARKQEVIDATLVEFPGCHICDANDHETDRSARFTFPGGLGAVTWQMGEATVMVAKRDVEAWHIYRKANPSKVAA